MPSIPDDTASIPEKKSTEIQDLPPQDEVAETSGDVKGGAALDPCFRAPRRGPLDRTVEPCFRPGGMS